jgi:pimeloyl-ACP methyl ester carboxylesterase
MKKRYWIVLILIVVLAVTYFTGPVPEEPEYNLKLPKISSSINDLDTYIADRESEKPTREDNQARIEWFGDTPGKTEYSIIYLHGFAGSYRDGYPVNQNIAKKLNVNIYYARWAGHGLEPQASLDDFNGENAWQSAKEALAIGKQIGEKVIIISTSTGGTLAFKLAAEFPEDVHALINMGPNLEDDQPGTFVLNTPWGYEIASLISFGDNRKIEHEQQIATQYWDTIYPSRALVDLQVLVETTMIPETFKKVKCPVLTLYYHKNFIQEDEHVEVDIYENIHKLLRTPDSMVVLKPLATPETHFVGSDIKSKDTEIVEKAIEEFLRNKLEINI